MDEDVNEEDSDVGRDREDDRHVAEVDRQPEAVEVNEEPWFKVVPFPGPVEQPAVFVELSEVAADALPLNKIGEDVIDKDTGEIVEMRKGMSFDRSMFDMRTGLIARGVGAQEVQAKEENACNLLLRLADDSDSGKDAELDLDDGAVISTTIAQGDRPEHVNVVPDPPTVAGQSEARLPPPVKPVQ